MRCGVETAVEEGYGDGCFDVDVLPANHAGEHASYQDVQNGANQQRRHDADGQIALRILAFLSGGGNGVKTDVCEENVSSTCADATEAHGRKRVPVVSPVVWIDIMNAEGDYEKHHGDLDSHDAGVEPRALLDADHEDGGDDQGNEEGRKVEANLMTENGWGVQKGVGLLRKFG